MPTCLLLHSCLHPLRAAHNSGCGSWLRKPVPSEGMKDGRFLLAGIEQHSGDSWCRSTWVMASPAGCSGPGKRSGQCWNWTWKLLYRSCHEPLLLPVIQLPWLKADTPRCTVCVCMCVCLCVCVPVGTGCMYFPACVSSFLASFLPSCLCAGPKRFHSSQAPCALWQPGIDGDTYLG